MLRRTQIENNCRREIKNGKGIEWKERQTSEKKQKKATNGKSKATKGVNGAHNKVDCARSKEETCVKASGRGHMKGGQQKPLKADYLAALGDPFKRSHSQG